MTPSRPHRHEYGPLYRFRGNLVGVRFCRHCDATRRVPCPLLWLRDIVAS